MTDISGRQRAHFNTYKKQKHQHVFMYKNPDTFQKTRQFPFRFYIQKERHFTLRNFS